MAEPHESGPPSAPREPERADGTGTTRKGEAIGGVDRGYVDWPAAERPSWGPQPAYEPPPPYATVEPGPHGSAPRRRERNPVPPALPSRRALSIELVAMFLLSFALPALSLFGGQETSAPSPDGFEFGVIASAVIQWFPIGVLYLLLRQRGGWANIGLTKIDGVDLVAGLLLWLASHLTVYVLGILTLGLGSNNVEFLPKALPVWDLAALAVVIAGTAGLVEEILVRGYAQTRLEQLRAPAFLIVVLPTALWGVLHLYQGPGPALVIFGLGLVYAIWFQRSRRLWPVIIAHILFDLSTLILYIISLKL